MQIRRLAGALVRVIISVLFAGFFYAGWLAVFLAGFKDSGVSVKAVLWAIAPVITAIGFAAGLAVGNLLTKTRRGTFLRTLIWPLAGCILGAVVVVWFGPMLIVFGMFLLGTGSVALREVVLQTRTGDG